MKVQVGQLVISDKLTALRTVDPFTVSRYRIAMRAGAQFPPVLVNRETMEVVSGNHRVTAYRAEFGDDHQIEVETRKFASEADMIEAFARENIANGRPMDRWTCRKIAIELTAQGRTLESVANLLNVPVAHLQQWGEHTVVVLGKRKVPQPVKGGITVPSGKMTEEQYTAHVTRDMGVTVRYLAEQLAWRLENGFRNSADEREVAALDRLRAAIQSV